MLLHASVVAMAAARMSEIVPARVATESNGAFCIGCSNATNGQIPWQASLQTTGHFCGGSILSATFVNTAAHCKQSGSFTVQVGNVDNQSGQKIRTKRFIGHPSYNGNLIIKDYGVIELSSSITMNSFTQPIPLVRAGSRPADGTPLMTSGFGYYEYDSSGNRPNRRTSRYLKFTDINYVSVARCRAAWPGQTIDDSVQCADKDGATICSGDSGGPLVRQIGGQYQLIGATSWAHTNCASYGRPQGWSNLYDSTYNAWTRQQAGL